MRIPDLRSYLSLPVTLAGQRTNRLVAVALSCTLLTADVLTGCAAPVKPTTQKPLLNVGFVPASGGLGDKSFNDSAYQGLLEAQKKYNIRFETATFATPEENLKAVRRFALGNYDLIVGIAYENAATIEQVAREFPQVKFALIDAELNAPNVVSVVYREQEGDFLMGVLAAMLTKTGKVGVMGGTDIPAIRRSMAGFKQGVVYQNANVTVSTDFAGTFSDPQVGFDRAIAMYNSGVDVIHNAASKTGLGIIQAAQQTRKLTTGTSGDQRYMAPGYMVGNRPKRVDTAVEMVIQEVQEGAFKSGVRSLGLKENGLSLGPFDDTLVTPAMMKRLEDLKQKIANGDIVVQAE